MSALAKPLVDLIHIWHEWTYDSKMLQKKQAGFQASCPVRRQVLSLLWLLFYEFLLVLEYLHLEAVYTGCLDIQVIGLYVKTCINSAIS